MGAIVRDAIVPYATARKMGWTDVDFVSQAASFDQSVAGAPGGVTEGLYVAAGTVMPYRDTANQTVAARWAAYKAKFGRYRKTAANGTVVVVRVGLGGRVLLKHKKMNHTTTHT